MGKLNLHKSHVAEKAAETLAILVGKRNDTLSARKQTENDVDVINKKIATTIEDAIKDNFKNTHFRGSLIISETSYTIRFEIDSWTSITEDCMGNVINNPQESINDITKTLQKLMDLRKSMVNYTPKKESFNVREDEEGSLPVFHVHFKTRTKYFK